MFRINKSVTAGVRLASAAIVAATVFASPAASAAKAAAMSAAAVAAWPSQPLRFIVPYPPGGPLDTMARTLAEKVAKPLGQAVVVENRPGAGGDIGADLVARAKPDGYTLVMGAVATHAINPWLFKNIPYDAIKDFAPVTIVASVPNVLVINPAFGKSHDIKNLPDLIAYAKKNPGQLNFGSGGNGSAGHLSGELLNARAGIQTQHVPYQGAAPAQLALLSGQSDFMFDNLAASAPMIKSGKVVVLAVTTKQRSSLLPSVPTVEDAGVKGFDLGTWFGVFTTGGTPPAIVAKLNKVYSDALREPDVRKLLLTMGSDIEPMTPADFAKFVRDEKDKYKEIVKLSGASVN